MLNLLQNHDFNASKCKRFLNMGTRTRTQKHKKQQFENCIHNKTRAMITMNMYI